MKNHWSRRHFLRTSAASGALLGLGDLGFLSRLPAVSAAEMKLDNKVVRLQPDIEPLVRLLEETPRDRLLEEVAARIRKGLSYREVLAALLLAGVRNIQPRPAVGFKFHSVLVVNSAHLASISSPQEHRWLPIFWALDYFKETQAQNAKENGWAMAPVDEQAVPSATKARGAFVSAMERWDEAAVDPAIAGLTRTAGANEIFELFFRFGARDFRSIGHKAIFVANSYRALQVIGWQHAEPVLRSLAYALQNREGDKQGDDAPADQPWKHNQELAAKIPATWQEGKPNDDATRDLLATLRTGSDEDACGKVVELLGKGVAPQSIWDALFVGAGELLARQPGIVALHAMTSTNAFAQAYQFSADDQTRRMLLLQNAAFLPLFRKAMAGRGKLGDFRFDALEGTPPGNADFPTVDDVFAKISDNRTEAASQMLGYLDQHSDPQPLIDAARVLVFLKGTNAHDYKFSSAVLEDYHRVSPTWRNRYLASSAFNLRGSGDKDNSLVQRTRAALKG